MNNLQNLQATLYPKIRIRTNGPRFLFHSEVVRNNFLKPIQEKKRHSENQIEVFRKFGKKKQCRVLKNAGHNKATRPRRLKVENWWIRN